MKDEILIRYINKHCTATEEKEILEWLKEKDIRGEKRSVSICGRSENE